MIIYPAIDLKDGQCVRLLRGDMNKATVFAKDPASQARQFEAAGAEWLHVVDLNGAFEGRPVNEDAVKAISAAISIPIQLGGGIRSLAQIDRWFDMGISRLILGTVAVNQPDLVVTACARYPDKIIVGIDALDGHVAVEGWAVKTQVKATDLAKKFEQAGVAAIIYTDINRDGLLAGPNITQTLKLADMLSIPVIASGGVAGLDDIIALGKRQKIAGVIIGRALYGGQIDLSTAIDISKSQQVMGKGTRC